MSDLLQIIQGDALAELRNLQDESVQCCVTSPPYWGLRDYDNNGQLGLEKTPEEYVAKLVAVMREAHRVLRKDGTLWLNLGDSYAGGGHGGGGSYESERFWRKCNPDKNGGNSNRDGLGRVSGLKPKDLCGIPWRVAFALQADDWWLRSDIIWSKPNPMPESVTDRPTKAHEYLFLLTKSASYYYDSEAIREQVKESQDGSIRAIARDRSGPVDIGNGAHIAERVYDRICGANKRSVWMVATAPYPEAHFATYPPDLIKPCIMAGSRPGDTILDPFAGSGTTGAVALELGRRAVLIELNPAYIELIEQRCCITPGLALA